MGELNKDLLLLELALHSYDEEVHRIESIDNRNKSIVAFLGVMLTIQCTILPRLIEFKELISSSEMSLLLIIFIISLTSYFFSLCYFSFQH